MRYFMAGIIIMLLLVAGQSCEKAQITTRCYHCEQLDIIDTIYPDPIDSTQRDTLYRGSMPPHDVSYCVIDSYHYYYSRGRARNCVYGN